MNANIRLRYSLLVVTVGLIMGLFIGCPDPVDPPKEQVTTEKTTLPDGSPTDNAALDEAPSDQVTPQPDQVTPQPDQVTPQPDQVTPEPSPTSGLQLMQSGKLIADQASYGTPGGNANQDSSSVAVFSELNERFTLQNKGDGEVQIKGIALVVDDGMMGEEFLICNDKSGLNKCLEFAPQSLKPDERVDFFVHFYPIASGKRTGTVTISYSDAKGDHSHTVKVYGFGRIGDNKLPANLLASGQPTSHKLWGGFKSSQDEAPGPMVSDSKGNIYIAGTAKELIGTSTSDQNIFVVQIKSDGTVGWQKVYHSSFHDHIAFTGDNGGLGAADALAIDESDQLYLAAHAANGANTKSLGLVMKIDTSDGSESWTRYWFGDKTRLKFTDGATAFAIDVKDGLVFITGTGKSDVSTQGIPVVALGTDGSYKWSKLIVPQGSKSSAHRGHSIKADGQGNLYIAGIDYSPGSGPFLAKLEGIDDKGDSVKLAWARTSSGETKGTNFNSMALDAQGNVFLAADRRGASSFFSIVKVAPDGSLGKGVTLPGSAGDRNNIYVVRVEGDAVYAGGRIGLPGWDTNQGDGMIAKLSTSNLDVQWAGLYYTGTGDNEICHHSVHGFALKGNQLFVMGQTYSGQKNFHRYWGYWYDFPQASTKYQPSLTDTTSTTLLVEMPNAGVVTKADEGFQNDGKWETIPASANIEFQDATAKNETSNGAAVDGEVFLMTLPLK